MQAQCLLHQSKVVSPSGRHHPPLTALHSPYVPGKAVRWVVLLSSGTSTGSPNQRLNASATADFLYPWFARPFHATPYSSTVSVYAQGRTGAGATLAFCHEHPAAERRAARPGATANCYIALHVPPFRPISSRGWYPLTRLLPGADHRTGRASLPSGALYVFSVFRARVPSVSSRA
jgi:hypothetical protein